MLSKEEAKKLAEKWWTIEELETALKDLKTSKDICKWADAIFPILGQGAYRKAYKIKFIHKLPKNQEEKIEAVLKVVGIESAWAVGCTKKEISLYKRTHSLSLTRIFACDPNEKKLWVVSELIPILLNWDEIREVCRYSRSDFKLEDVPEKYMLLIKFLRRNPKTITDWHPGNLGFRKDGRPVVIDYGQ